MAGPFSYLQKDIMDSFATITFIIGVCLGTAVGIGITSLAWYITNKLDKE